VAVGDGSVCLLERSGMGNRILSGPVDTLQIGVIPIIPREDWGEASQYEVGENISTEPKREFPGREFRNDLDDKQGPDAGADEVFWKKSTTRKPTPAAAWDWDRMSSQTVSSNEPFPSKEAPLEVRGERTKHTTVLDGSTTGCIGYPNVEASHAPSIAIPSRNEIIALERVTDGAPMSRIRQEGAVRRLKLVVDHLTGVATPNDLDHNREMRRARSVTSED
jgi:hypothetical protein